MTAPSNKPQRRPTNEDLPPLPSTEEFIFRTPLYERFALPKGLEEFLTWKYFMGTVDTFCPKCGKPGLFSRVAPEDGDRGSDRVVGRGPTGTMVNVLRTGWHDMSYQCYRCDLVVHVRCWVLKEIQKVGQMPSVADLNVGDLKRFRSLLGPERHRELVRAHGLASHGVGIGSFAYLRRIFEALIEEAHLSAKEQNDFDEGAYQRSRMDEKILALRGVLPSFLVENRALYGIMSKGIHELGEDECLAHFTTVSVGIEFILDEKLAKLEAARREEKARKAIEEAARKLTPRSRPTAEA